MSPPIMEPVTTQSVSSLLQQMNASNTSRTSEGSLDESSRKQILAAAKKLVATLEQPTDVIMQYAWEVSSFFLD